MKIIISQELTKIFNDAMEYARQEKHRYLTIEHMFYCLFDNENIQLIFKKLNINTQSIQNAIEQYFDHHMEKVSQIDTVYRPTETLSLSKSIDEMFLNIKNSNRKEAVAIDMFFCIIFG